MTSPFCWLTAACFPMFSLYPHAPSSPLACPRCLQALCNPECTPRSTRATKRCPPKKNWSKRQSPTFQEGQYKKKEKNKKKPSSCCFPIAVVSLSHIHPLFIVHVSVTMRLLRDWLLHCVAVRSHHAKLSHPGCNPLQHPDRDI